MDPFVAQLAHLCTTHRTRAKWVFVPTHALGRTLGDRLALEGTDWANLRFVTPLDIALRMGAPFLVERGINPSEEQAYLAAEEQRLLYVSATRARDLLVVGRWAKSGGGGVRAWEAFAPSLAGCLSSRFPRRSARQPRGRRTCPRLQMRRRSRCGMPLTTARECRRGRRRL